MHWADAEQTKGHLKSQKYEKLQEIHIGYTEDKGKILALMKDRPLLTFFFSAHLSADFKKTIKYIKPGLNRPIIEAKCYGTPYFCPA